MSLWQFLEDAAGRGPERLAVVDGASRRSYAELHARSAALASWFREQGVRAGDRISILDLNTGRFLEAYFAAAGLGAILNPLNFRLSAAELAFILDDAGSRWLVAAPEFAAVVDGVLAHGAPVAGLLSTAPFPERACRAACALHDYESIAGAKEAGFRPATVDPKAVAQLYYTSGTTGHPKGVMLTHENVAVHARNVIAELGLSSGDVWGHFAPMFHLADAWATFAITAALGTHVMLPRFDAEAAITLIESERITLSNLVPTMLNAMVKHPGVHDRDFRSLRLILSGGAPIAPALVRRIMTTFGCEYVQTYGMTETSPYLTLSLLHPHLRSLPEEERFRYQAKTGRPFLGIELKVVRDDGTPVRADGREVGEIRVRGRTVTPGYWKRPDETARSFDGDWLKTGDLAVLDAEGYVDIVDRKKDVIITGGEKVYSTEVEHALYEHAAVLEAAAFGRPDETWGEAVTAAVVLRPGTSADADELLRHCRERLSGYKVPKAIEFLAELPKTGTGKISKKTLRERRPPEVP